MSRNQPERELVLVVDRDVTPGPVSAALRQRGYLVAMASSAAEALALLSGSVVPSVAMVDLGVTMDHGGSLVAELQAHPVFFSIPIVVMARGIVPVSVRGGAAGYLSKPIDVAELVDVLDRVLPVRRRRSSGVRRVSEVLRGSDRSGSDGNDGPTGATG